MLGTRIEQIKHYLALSKILTRGCRASLGLGGVAFGSQSCYLSESDPRPSHFLPLLSQSFRGRVVKIPGLIYPLSRMNPSCPPETCALDLGPMGQKKKKNGSHFFDPLSRDPSVQPGGTLWLSPVEILFFPNPCALQPSGQRHLPRQMGWSCRFLL